MVAVETTQRVLSATSECDTYTDLNAVHQKAETVIAHIQKGRELLKKKMIKNDQNRGPLENGSFLDNIALERKDDQLLHVIQRRRKWEIAHAYKRLGQDPEALSLLFNATWKLLME